jgi:monofunctional biosynthetic peptidoglycan transglycosylase
VEKEVSASEPAEQIAEARPVGHPPVADPGPPPAPKPAVEAPDAFADASAEGPVTELPAETPSQPALVELIPEVLPASPKLPALSPSMAPVLRPFQIEHFPPPPPEPETVAPAPQPPAAPQVIFPPPPLAPEPPPTRQLGHPPPAEERPEVEGSRAFLPPPAARIERRYVFLAVHIALVLCVGAACLLLALLLFYRWVDPPASTLMVGQRLTGTTISQRWVPLERISPNLAAAVISSEDGHFCRHHGVDWGELKEAIESAGDGIARGGSTISMQVVKNLFLWPSRSYVRKALEIPLAYAMEALWPKRRILEIYLNIAEWGPGIFGAEAAARYHFRKSALTLNAREAALLAVSLPNPFDRQAGRPGPGTVRLADNLLLRMRAAQPSTACLRTGAGRG